MKELLVNVISPSKAQLFMTYAAHVAREMELTVKYLHIVTPPATPLGFPGGLGAAVTVNQKEIDDEIDKMKHHLDLQVSKLNASDPDLPLLEFEVKVGAHPDIIEEYCRSKNVSAVMLSGPREKSVLSEHSGNVEIIRRISCPIWIVPEGITYKPFSEIMYATDYHEEDIPNMKTLAGFASKFPAGITAIHITSDPDFEEKVKGEGFAAMIRKETGYANISLKVLPEQKGEPLVDEIHRFALMIDADLIVLLRENKGFIDRLLHGSRSEKIAKKTQLPVLIYNEERK